MHIYMGTICLLRFTFCETKDDEGITIAIYGNFSRSKDIYRYSQT